MAALRLPCTKSWRPCDCSALSHGGLAIAQQYKYVALRLLSNTTTFQNDKIQMRTYSNTHDMPEYGCVHAIPELTKYDAARKNINIPNGLVYGSSCMAHRVLLVSTYILRSFQRQRRERAHPGYTFHEGFF